MNVFKRVTTLVGVVALAASSLLATDAMAQGIGTTITVDNSAPQCEVTPSSIQLSHSGGDANLSFGTLIGSSTNFNNKEIQGQSLYMNMYINTCVTNWSVTASITDFHSGSNTVGSVGKVGVYAQTGMAQFNIAYNLPVRPTGTATSPFSTGRQVPGTSGLPTSANGIGGRQFVSAGPGTGNLTHTISTGSVESTGEMIQAIKLGLVGVPTTTTPGTYTATLTLTLTTTSP